MRRPKPPSTPAPTAKPPKPPKSARPRRPGKVAPPPAPASKPAPAARRTAKTSRRVRKSRPIIGWTEYVSFPAWGIHAVKAKVDTGAGISALHVDSVRQLADGRVRFEVVLHRSQRHLRATAEAAVLRRSRIKSSNGLWQERYVVGARIRLGSLERDIEVSLVSRPDMVYRMLLGRAAVAGLLIDVSAQCRMGIPQRAAGPGRGSRAAAAPLLDTGSDAETDADAEP